MGNRDSVVSGIPEGLKQPDEGVWSSWAKP